MNKWIDSDEVAAACARLQLPPEAEQLAAPDDGGRWDEAAGHVLDEHREAWQALADGAIGGRDGVPARDLTSGG